MKFVQLALVAGALGLSLACDGEPKDTIGDTFGDTAGNGPATPAPDALIWIINPNGCNAGGTSFDFAIENRGWAGSAVLTIWDTSFDPTYDEEHVMEYVGSGRDDPYDPNEPGLGYWDQWSVSLSDEASLAGQVPGQSTVFNCDNQDFLTYAIEVYDQSNTAVSDCAVFGDDPSALINGTWPGTAANPNGTVIGNRFANCLDWN